MQGRPKTRKNNFLKRPDQRSLDRRERRKKQRAMSLQQTISEEDNRTIADLQAKYGSGPFLAADAVVQSRDGHVLLIQRGNPPSKGVHALPGGKLDDGETFYQAALRELMEETGLVSVVGGRVEQIDWDWRWRVTWSTTSRTEIRVVAGFRSPTISTCLSTSASCTPRRLTTRWRLSG